MGLVFVMFKMDKDELGFKTQAEFLEAQRDIEKSLPVLKEIFDLTRPFLELAKFFQSSGLKIF